jgi:hypothetical protein
MRQGVARAFIGTTLKWAGTCTGLDIEKVDQKLARGIGIICCIAPDAAVIGGMQRLYAMPPVLVWINTSLQTANERLLESGDTQRIARIGHRLQSDTNAKTVKSLASLVFDLANDLQLDRENLIYTVSQIMSDGSK